MNTINNVWILSINAGELTLDFEKYRSDDIKNEFAITVISLSGSDNEYILDLTLVYRKRSKSFDDPFIMFTSDFKYKLDGYSITKKIEDNEIFLVLDKNKFQAIAQVSYDTLRGILFSKLEGISLIKETIMPLHVMPLAVNDLVFKEREENKEI